MMIENNQPRPVKYPHPDDQAPITPEGLMFYGFLTSDRPNDKLYEVVVRCERKCKEVYEIWGEEDEEVTHLGVYCDTGEIVIDNCMGGIEQECISLGKRYRMGEIRVLCEALQTWCYPKMDAPGTPE